MNATAISPTSRGEKRYRAYLDAIRRGKKKRHFLHGLKVALIGIAIGVIGALIIAAWQFPT